MRLNSKHSLIKNLLADQPHGQPFGLAELAGYGISPYLAAQHARRGWLDRLAQGVYAFPNDVLQLDASLLFLQNQAPSLHVGGKTALDWQGVRHNVSSRATIQLWGAQRYNLPDWFIMRFPARYFHRDMFTASHALPDGGYATLADHAAGLRVSCRERAVLEMLDEVGLSQDLEEATHLFESISSLRIDVVGGLLEACKRVKTVRLFLQLAERTGVVDLAALHAGYSMSLGSASRWTRRLQDGSLLSLKMPC